MVGYVGVARFFQLSQRGFCTAATAAVEVDRCVFIRADGFDAVNDLVMRNIERTLQMAFFKFFGRADINPNAFLLLQVVPQFFSILGIEAAEAAKGVATAAAKVRRSAVSSWSISY